MFDIKIDFKEVEKLIEDTSKEFKKTKGIKVGYIGDQAYPNGFKIRDNAVLQEFGGEINIPEREGVVYQKINEKTGELQNKGRFVKKEKSNFSQKVTIKETKIIIPPRPFLRKSVDKYSEEWKKLFIFYLKKEMPVSKALNLVGEEMKNSIKKSIDETTDPPNAPSTIKQKGSSHPLIDTGTMKNSIQKEKIK